MPFSCQKENNNSHSKKKFTRVSRFVADIRSSSKHGESLVVQTGFPTSLIDLIVKNRDRLNKKKTRKNNSQNEIVACCSEIEDGEDGPVLPISIPLAPFILNAINNLFGDDKNEDDSDESSKQQSLNEDSFVDFDVSSSSKFYKIFIMMSVVLVLALATKRLVIGITLSAFLLFFIEFCCNNLISLLKSCINGCKGFMVSIHLGKDKNLIGVEERVVNNFVGFREEFDDLIKEKRIKEIDSEELGKHDRLCDLLDCERKREIEEDGEDNAVENVELGRPRRTRSAKLRAAQFKKFMVKKFGSESKKKRKGKEGELDSCTLENERLLEGDIGEEDAGEDNGDDNEDVDEQEVKKVKAAQFKKFMVKKFGAESKKKRKSKECELNSNTLENENVVERDIWEEEDNENDDEQELKKVDRPDSKDLSEVHREVGFQEGLGRKVIWSSRNLVPVLVILSGLVCGRALALGLSVAWLVLRNLHKVVKIYLKR